jgi:hypothetical protein
MANSKNSLNNIEKLRKMNKKEISAQTHISVKSLEHIINSDYDELHKTKTQGFIRILEKTYGLDLSEWLKEFVEYKDSIPAPETIVMNQHIEEKKSKAPLIFALIIAIFVIIYFIFPTLSKESTDSTDSNQIMADIKDNLSEAKTITEANKKEIAKNQDTIAIDNKLDNIKSDDKKEEKKDTVKKSEEQRLTISVPHNKPLDGEITKDNSSSNEVVSTEPLEQMELLTNKLIVKPRGKVWVGIINTKNFTRLQKTIKKEGDLELKDGHLLITGHSYFTFINEGVSYEYKDMKASYFYYKDGVLNKITKSYFKKLNRDSMW